MEKIIEKMKKQDEKIKEMEIILEDILIRLDTQEKLLKKNKKVHTYVSV
jgi:hypothetical protein